MYYKITGVCRIVMIEALNAEVSKGIVWIVNSFSLEKSKLSLDDLTKAAFQRPPQEWWKL